MSPSKRVALLALVSSIAFARHAGAADPGIQVTQPPPPQYWPPPQYPPGPPYPPIQYQPPSPYPPQGPYIPQSRSRRYRDGDPVPAGYHLEDQPRNGLVVGGWVLLLVPYGLSAVTALGTKGDNESTWLYAPVVGPWITLGRRAYNGCDPTQKGVTEGLGCTADVFAVMGLVLDGALQATGITLLLLGYLNPRTVVVRDEPALRIFPARIGSGQGVGVRWTF
ncbi:MAG TPA: hypothetical protein VIF09_26355 [Polyangiaceae bacterium]|jgi:hypothetical protein